MKGKLAGIGSIVVGAAVFAVLWMNNIMNFQTGFLEFIVYCIGLAMIGLIILGLLLAIYA